MRHGNRMAGPVTLLAEGVPPGSLRGRLVPPAGGPDGFEPADDATGGAAILLPPVTAGADADLLPALTALEDPMALFDGYRTSGTLALDKCGKRANTLRQLSSRAVRRRPSGENLGSPFLFGALGACFYPMGPASCERQPISSTARSKPRILGRG